MRCSCHEYYFSTAHYKDNIFTNTVLCMITQSLLSADYWIEAYQKDHDMAYIFKPLQPKAEFTEKGMHSQSVTYRHPLRKKRIKLLNGRIVVMNQIGSTNRFLTLIVVPKDIQRIIFHAYHTTPMSAHMGRYKTLFSFGYDFSGQKYEHISLCEYKE